jgi:hypothetical protein
MTVSSTTDRKLYTGDDATVAFATSPVVFFDETDLEVYIITTATGVSVQQTLTTDYTVSGGAGSTGTVTMLTAPASTEKLLIKRVVPATQPSDFVNNDASDAEVVEDALDRLTMIAQQKNADSDYPIRLSDAETPTDALTVLPFDRASKVLAFNSSKELIATESEEAAALSAALAESGGSSLIGFVQSGIGALTTRTVEAALRAITRTGDYDTAANFGTATDALTETIGINAIQAPADGLDFTFPTNAELTKDSVLTFIPYEFGMKIGLAGSGQNHDNRLEFYLGSADTTAAELSVRHNGNNTGALIQARNATDSDGIQINFEDSTYPHVRWGNAGPYLVKDGVGVLNLRNPTTVGEAQRLFISRTYTPGGALEYLQLGAVGGNFVLRTTGSGGGTTRTLIIDAATINFQEAGTSRWNIYTGGHLITAVDNAIDIGASGATRPRTIYAGTSIVAPAYTVGATAGATFNGAVTNLTVVNGIVTAAS